MVYRVVTPCSFDRQPEISEEQVASFFRMNESAMRGTSRRIILLVRPKFGPSTGCCDFEGTEGNVRRWKPLPSNDLVCAVVLEVFGACNLEYRNYL
jgi:hypothetical protein